MVEQSKLTVDFWLGMTAPIIVTCLVLPVILLNSFVLSEMWAWYISPLFHLPLLTIAHSFGISLLLRFLVEQPRTKNDSLKEIFAYQIGSPILVFVLGWIGTFFL